MINSEDQLAQYGMKEKAEDEAKGERQRQLALVFKELRQKRQEAHELAIALEEKNGELMRQEVVVQSLQHEQRADELRHNQADSFLQQAKEDLLRKAFWRSSFFGAS